MKRFEELLVDSQRKHSAPVNMNYQRLSDFSHPGDLARQNDLRREILTITVDIGNPDGDTANILIREGDDPT